MQNGEITAQNTPGELYQNPTSNYVASLFDDVNEIPGNYFTQNETQLLYPHQLKIIPESNLKVTVTNTFFKGNFYLIEATFPGGILYFENEIFIQPEKVVCLTKK